MIKSVYLDAFKSIDPSGRLDIIGEFMIVEEVNPQELEVTSKSGLVLTGSSKNADGFSQNRPTLVHVLAVGAGFVGEEGEGVPLTTQPGDVIMVGSQSVKWLSNFCKIPSTAGARLGITTESEIQLRFKGVDAYNSFANELVGEAKNEQEN